MILWGQTQQNSTKFRMITRQNSDNRLVKKKEATGLASSLACKSWTSPHHPNKKSKAELTGKNPTLFTFIEGRWQGQPLPPKLQRPNGNVEKITTYLSNHPGAQASAGAGATDGKPPGRDQLLEAQHGGIWEAEQGDTVMAGPRLGHLTPKNPTRFLQWISEKYRLIASWHGEGQETF